MDLDAQATSLLGPLREEVAQALSKMGVAPIPVVMGEENGFYRLERGRVVLSLHLLGPAGFHPLEQVEWLPPLDRARRAAASIVEATTIHALSQHVGLAPGEDWAWQGWAVYQADQALEGWGIAEPERVRAMISGDLHAHPRSGVVVCQAWAAEGEDVPRRIIDLIANDVRPSSEEWLRVGAWVYDLERGPHKHLPVVLPRRAAIAPPQELSPWSWYRVHVGSDVRGGEILVTGRGAVTNPWCVAGEPHETVLGHTLGEGRLTMGPGAPLGQWCVASMQGFGEVMGARGVTLSFSSTGRFVVTLEDGFVGPLAGLPVQDHEGISGAVKGRWGVSGAKELAFSGMDLEDGMSTRDPRVRLRPGLHLPKLLEALQGGSWAWMCRGDRLFLQGALEEQVWEIRLNRGGGDP
jgi:hypothetical protein